MTIEQYTAAMWASLGLDGKCSDCEADADPEYNGRCKYCAADHFGVPVVREREFTKRDEP